MARRVLSNVDQRYFLEQHPPTKIQLIRWLAEGKDQVWCAEQLQCSQTGISSFKKRHAVRIAQVAADIENEFAGMLYTQKASRLAVYEQTIEQTTRKINELLDAGRVPDLDDEGAEVSPGADISDAHARYERTRHRALRQTAEELGQLPSRMALVVESGKLRHEIVGIDPEKDL